MPATPPAEPDDALPGGPQAPPPPPSVDAPPEPPSGGSKLAIGQVLASILLSLAVLAVIAYFTFDAAEFRQMLRRLNPWMLALAVFSLVPRIVLGGWRLNLVSNRRLSLMDGIRAQLAWDFFSNVTPSAVGGGPVATVYIAKDNRIPMGDATAFMLFAMLLDQIWFAVSIPILLVTSTYLPVFPESLGRLGTGLFVGAFLGTLAWIVFFGYVVLLKPEWMSILIERVFRLRWLHRFRRRAVEEAERLKERAALLRSQPFGFFFKGFLITTGTWLARFALPLFIVWSVFPSLEKLLLVLRMMAMSLATVLLPTPGGAGGVEGLYALFLGPLMPGAMMAPTLLMWRVLGYYLFIALGVYLTMHQVQKTQQRRAEQANGADDAAA